jgi:hypothetical protein
LARPREAHRACRIATGSASRRRRRPGLQR